MAKIEVYHSGEHVANINYPLPITDVIHALEYAWRWTNNVEGSWSIKEEQFSDGSRNGDYNPNVEVVAPLKDYGGRKLGHRSSMVGDVFKIDGKAYTVASFGFKDENGEEV